LISHGDRINRQPVGNKNSANFFFFHYLSAPNLKSKNLFLSGG
jgi:hypothetical protein